MVSIISGIDTSSTAGSTEASITGSMAAAITITDARRFRAVQSAYFVGSLTNAILLRPAFEASASVSATKR